MIIPTTQSDIGEVRDQLSLDRADGKYLNVVTSNLGLQRPPFGFNDATWRAIARVLGIQYKQIKHKFEAVLAIILGPKITQCGALAQDVLAGSKYAVLVDTEQFPQVGTMVIDEGLATEESVQYNFIDRHSNVVYFDTPLQFNHTAVGQTWESGVISDFAPGASFLNVFDASGFKDPSLGQYTICIGRGTQYEMSGPLSSLDLDARKLGIPFPPLGGTGASSAAGIQLRMTFGPSQVNTYYLTFDDVTKLKLENGWLQSGALSTVYTATAGTTTSVTVAGPIAESRYGGFWIRFTGNITAALANAVAYVEDNTTTVFTFGNTLPTPPVAGDTFHVLNNFQYIRVDNDDKSVLKRRELPDLLQYPNNCEFTVLNPTVTVAIAQVQVKGTGWDVFQSDPRHVEILLPTEFLENDLRSASYIRQTGMSGTASADAVRNFGDTDISVTTTNGMPLIGVLNHVAADQRYAYYNPHAWVTQDADIGAVQIKVTDTSQFLATGTLRYGSSTVLYSVVDETTLSTGPLPAAIRVTDLVRDEKRLRLAKGLLNAVAVLDTIDFYASYDSGDIWNVDDVWPGPYVWDLLAHIHKKETSPGNTSTESLSGPTVLSVDRLLNATVFELDDASSFPTAVPYNVLVGENSGNIETLSVQQLSLKSRTYETTASIVNIGDLSVTLNSLAGPVAPANEFPNGGPYRVVIEPFSANQEVLEVIGTSGGNTLLLSTGASISHAIGSRVVLLSDLIRVSPAGADDHIGKVSYSNRFDLYAPETQTTGADMVRPLYDQFTLASGGTDFNADSGSAVINFGNAVLKAGSHLAASVAAGATVVTLDSTANFPTSGYPYVVYLDVGAGPLKQEALHVINNNTGTNQLTFSHGTVFSHDAGRLVEFRPGLEEVISYTSRTGGVLDFTPYLEIENTHYKMEFVAPSVGTGYPRRNGFDFPLRLPVTVEDRIRFVIDLIRAAGVEVTFISKR